MRILAIDPGKRAGWCLWDAGYIGSGVTDGDDLDEIRRLLQFLPDVVVVEDQFFRPGKLKGIKTLMRRRFAWEILAMDMDLDVADVPAPRWQAWYQIRIGDKTAISKMAQTISERDVKPDEADAICMAFYWEHQCESADTSN